MSDNQTQGTGTDPGATAVMPPAEPPSQPPASTTPSGEPPKKSPGFWVLIGVVAAIVAIAALFGAFALGRTGKAPAPSSSSGAAPASSGAAPAKSGTGSSY